MKIERTFVPACRHAVRTISLFDVSNIRRVVSEDSDQILSGLPTVHQLDDLEDLDQSFARSMAVLTHETDTLRELLEVLSLGGPQAVLPKERDDHLEQVSASPHYESVEILPMVIVPVIGDHLADPEVLTHLMKDFETLAPLSYCELVR